MALINKSKCIGCGACASICPEGIKMVSGKAVIKNESATCLKKAQQACPVNAITLDKNKMKENSAKDKTSNIEIGQDENYNESPRQGFGQDKALAKAEDYKLNNL